MVSRISRWFLCIPRCNLQIFRWFNLGLRAPLREWSLLNKHQVFNQGMAASDSASSSRVPSGEYEVFISFRGADVRFGFLSHLEERLRQKNIDVYVDDRLERGEEISSSLVKAIKGSKIALVIFSKDYASSKWCLEELVKIMERKEANQQIVIPVFYHVDPSDVRNQKSTYDLERKFKDNVDKLQIWRSVLKKSANLSGHHLTKFPDESKLVDAIVEDVLKKLRDNSPIKSNSHLIGRHQNFTSVESLMKLEPKGIAPIIGIWGMGGIGKTTLAQAIFDKFLSEFKSHHCFLKNVREKSTKIDGLNSLRQKLFSELLKEKDDIDMNDALRRLEGKKVLIVVDDANNPKQLEHLVGGHFRHLLGKDSRILVTSRDKHVLESTWIDEKYIHEVNVLNFEESLELFSVRAFKQRQPEMEYQELSKRTVAIAGGIPLALEVLGSHFCRRKKEYWESELDKLKKCPHREVQNILMISYDGFDAMDKEIFLDIAFFFVGKQLDQVACVLQACGFNAISGIQNLEDKALIKSQYGLIVMHDLIREMAEQIVRENPETRSRINDADELCGMLESNKGTDKIEGIILYSSEGKCLQLGADIFKKMPNLRIIKFLVPVKLHALESFPNKLRYLHWYDYPLENLPSISCFENLVELDMRNNNCKKLWDGKQDLANLKEINLSGSKQLKELPDFSMARRLEIVDLSGCEYLKSVHPSILSLHTIVEMYVDNCKRLESLESDTCLESLSELSLEGCASLKRFCLSSKKLEHIFLQDSFTVEALHFSNGQCTELRELFVYSDRLSSLQLDGLYCSTNLEQFKVTEFKQEIDTKVLYSLFDAWYNLKYLCLDGWSYLTEIPDSINGLTSLVALSLNKSSVEILPALNNLLSLKYIDLGSNKKLKSILGLPPSLKELDAGECTSLETICSGPLLQNRCGLSFFNCVKLDESSLDFIENLTNSSMTSSFIHDQYCELHDEYHGYYDEYCLYDTVCYPGSKVPKWMKYKQMSEASRAIEFTCNPKRLDGIVLCCIAPGLIISDLLAHVCCRISYGDNNEFFNDDYFEGVYHKSDSDHVFLWFMDRYFLSPISSNDIKISCKFFIRLRNGCWKLRDCPEYPIEACGVHLIYSLVSKSEPEPEKEPELEPEPEPKRKRVADICIEDQLSPKKRLNNSGISANSPVFGHK